MKRLFVRCICSTLPWSLRVVNTLFLLPILAAPIIFFGSIFVFDNPPSTFVGIAWFLAINSYSLVLIGIVKLTLWLYDRKGSLFIAHTPHFFIVLILFGVYLWGVVGPITDRRELSIDDYRLFRGTPAEELAAAVRWNRTGKIKHLLEHSPQLVNYQEDIFGQTVLHLACYRPHSSTLKALLRNKANPNIRDYYAGRTPLFIIVDAFNLSDEAKASSVALLANYGADVNIATSGMDKKRLKAKEYCDDVRLPGEYLACNAAGNGDLKTLQVLMNNGGDINSRYDSESYTALLSAIISEHYDVAFYLLNHGADVFPTMFERKANAKMLVQEALKEDWHTSTQVAELKKLLVVIRQKEQARNKK
ncbi:MAG TPA: ankyrin repeat domain-containing protein [Prevotella sp.]